MTLSSLTSELELSRYNMVSVVAISVFVSHGIVPPNTVGGIRIEPEN